MSVSVDGGLSPARYAKIADIRAGSVGANLVVTITALQGGSYAMIGDETGIIMLDLKPIAGDKGECGAAALRRQIFMHIS